MIDVFGSSSFVAYLEMTQGVPDDGIYSFNRQYGIHTHDDGNATYQLVAHLPSGVTPAEVAGLAYNANSGILALLTNTGVYRMHTTPGGPHGDWKADGEYL